MSWFVVKSGIQTGMTAASEMHDMRLAALNVPLIKATVSVGGGSSHSEAQSESLAHDGSTLTGKNVTIIASGSGTKDAAGYATDGDISKAPAMPVLAASVTSKMQRINHSMILGYLLQQERGISTQVELEGRLNHSRVLLPKKMRRQVNL